MAYTEYFTILEKKMFMRPRYYTSSILPPTNPLTKWVTDYIKVDRRRVVSTYFIVY